MPSDEEIKRAEKNKQEIIEELGLRETILLSPEFIDLVVETVISGLNEYEQFLKEKILKKFKPEDGHILIMGIPGAGKSTQGKHLAEILEIPYIATGELLREEVKNKTPLGLEAQTYMLAGDLVPDEIVISMVKEQLHGKKMCIVDGFPRNRAQVEAHPDFAQGAIALNLADGDAIDRLTGRKDDDGNLRDDDQIEIITKRLTTYHELTKPVIENYKERGKLTEVDQEKEEKDWMVFATLIAKLTAESI